MDRAYNTEILIAGGSFGGVSAALAACKAGRRAVSYTHLDVYKRQVVNRSNEAIDAAQ